jgi:hypothetical protein
MNLMFSKNRVVLRTMKGLVTKNTPTPTAIAIARWRMVGLADEKVASPL